MVFIPDKMEIPEINTYSEVALIPVEPKHYRDSITSSVICLQKLGDR